MTRGVASPNPPIQRTALRAAVDRHRVRRVLGRLLLLVPLGECLVGCENQTTLHVSDRNLHVARLVRTGEVTESDLKAEILDLARGTINSQLAEAGISSAFEKNWKVVESDDYTVICGSAPRTRNDIWAFMFVFRTESGLVYYEIGDDGHGEFPLGALPEGR